MIDARWRWRFFWQGGDQKTTADDRPAVRLLFYSKGGGGDLVVPRRKSNYLLKTRATYGRCVLARKFSMEVGSRKSPVRSHLQRSLFRRVYTGFASITN